MELGGYLGLTAQALALLVVLYGPLGPLPILLCPDLFHVWLTYMNFITKAPGLAGIGLANGRHQQEIKVRRRKTLVFSPGSPGKGSMVTASTRGALPESSSPWATLLRAGDPFLLPLLSGCHSTP